MSNSKKETLIILKPDCVSRGLIGQVLERFEQRRFVISKMKMVYLNDDLLSQHYAEHREKPFFDDLCSYMKSGAVVVAVLETEDTDVDIVSVVRKMVGSTDSGEADPGTIRGDFGLTRKENLVHASDSYSSSKREIQIFF